MGKTTTASNGHATIRIPSSWVRFLAPGAVGLLLGGGVTGAGFSMGGAHTAEAVPMSAPPLTAEDVRETVSELLEARFDEDRREREDMLAILCLLSAEHDVKHTRCMSRGSL